MNSYGPLLVVKIHQKELAREAQIVRTRKAYRSRNRRSSSLTKKLRSLWTTHT